MVDAVHNRVVRLLRWSEQYTKTDMVYLSKGGFWLTVSQAVGTLASLATSVAFANWLPEETYGTFRYVISILPILTIATLPGIDTALTSAVAQGKDSTVYSALSLKMRWGLLGLAASLGLALYYYLQGNLQLAFIFAVTAGFIPFMEPFNLFVSFLTGKKDFERRTYLGIIPRLVPTLVLVTVVFLSANILILMSAYFISYTLSRFIALRLSIKNVTRTGPTDRAALGFGKHLSLMRVLSIISTSLDSILIFNISGAAALAGYYLALVPYKQLSDSVEGLRTIALPKFAPQDISTLKNTLPRKVVRLYLVIVPLILAYVVAAPYLFSLFYPKYIEYVYLSDFFLLQLLFFPIGFFTSAFTAHGAKKELYIYSTSYALLRIGLVLFLTPLYGIWGAASAIVLTGLITSGLTTFLFYRFK